MRCIPDDLLRGLAHRSLVRVAREISPNAVIIANAIDIDEVQHVYAAGADFVYLSRFESAWTLQKAVQEGLDDGIERFRNKRKERNHYSEDRKEILS